MHRLLQLLIIVLENLKKFYDKVDLVFPISAILSSLRLQFSYLLFVFA